MKNQDQKRNNFQYIRFNPSTFQRPCHQENFEAHPSNTKIFSIYLNEQSSVIKYPSYRYVSFDHPYSIHPSILPLYHSRRFNALSVQNIHTLHDIFHENKRPPSTSKFKGSIGIKIFNAFLNNS